MISGLAWGRRFPNGEEEQVGRAVHKRVDQKKP
jgi:hypothetical protein